MRSERAQRLIDVAGAIIGLLILAPVLTVIAILIVLDDGGPVLFRQVRVGRYGKDFSMLKFRSMLVDAERRGGLLTVAHDPRVTRVGRWLRRLKLDELPQLLNVVAGDMSLVGPRPEVRRYVDLYTSDQRRVLELRPGITDPASLAYYHEADMLAGSPDPESTYISEIMPSKIAMNLAYAGRASIGSDLAIVFRTLARPWGDATSHFAARPR